MISPGSARKLVYRFLSVCTVHSIVVSTCIYSDLQDVGIDTIHLQPAWKDIPENVAHVSRIDSHPSALVHQSIAEYLVDIFRQRGWLETGRRLAR